MASEEKIQLMPLGEIKPYEDAPFKVRLDENMEELVESIKENGVLVPTIARPHTDGGVEMLAGHRRLKACELAGLDKLPVIVKNLDDDSKKTASFTYKGFDHSADSRCRGQYTNGCMEKHHGSHSKNKKIFK